MNKIYSIQENFNIVKKIPSVDSEYQDVIGTDFYELVSLNRDEYFKNYKRDDSGLININSIQNDYGLKIDMSKKVFIKEFYQRFLDTDIKQLLTPSENQEIAKKLSNNDLAEQQVEELQIQLENLKELSDSLIEEDSNNKSLIQILEAQLRDAYETIQQLKFGPPRIFNISTQSIQNQQI